MRYGPSPVCWRCAVLTRMKYSGFAFGVGLERIALLKYEIDDMRLLYEERYPFPETVLKIMRA